jgi:CRISPR type IV-associated protein Csf3
MTAPGPLIPLVIRARLASGIAWAAPWGISLDGLLAAEIWADRKAAMRDRGEDPPDPAGEPEDLDLPLARCAAAGPQLWHWAATCAFPEGTACELPDVRYWTARADARACEQTAAMLPAVISARQGRYRSRRMPLLVTVCASVSWHAVGDPATITAILAGLAAIGKKRSCGEGQVLSWQVTPADRTVWEAGHLHADGTLGRPAPAACLAGRDVTTGGHGTAALRPPSMHSARHRDLLLPAHPGGLHGRRPARPRPRSPAGPAPAPPRPGRDHRPHP